MVRLVKESDYWQARLKVLDVFDLKMKEPQECYNCHSLYQVEEHDLPAVTWYSSSYKKFTAGINVLCPVCRERNVHHMHYTWPKESSTEPKKSFWRKVFG